MIPTHPSLADALEGLRHRSAIQRSYAVGRVAKFVGPEGRGTERDALEAAAALTVHLSRDSDAGIRGECALALREAGIPQVVQALAERLLTDPSALVRDRCALALMFQDEPPPVAAAALVGGLDDEHPSVVRLCACALRHCPGQAVLAPLVRLLTHPDWTVRYQAVVGLIDRGAVDERVVAAIEQMAREPDAAEHDAMLEMASRLPELTEVPPGTFGGGTMAEIHAAAQERLEPQRSPGA